MIKGKKKLFCAIASVSMIAPNTIGAYANVTAVNEARNANIMEVVKTDSLNVRTGPGTNYKKIGTLKRGQRITVLSTSGGWAKFNFNGKTGYVSLSYLSKVQSNDNTNNGGTTTAKEMVVKADFLNVRKGSSTSHAVIGKIYEGDIVKVVQELSNGWVKIEFNNGYGYVSNVKGTYLETVSSSNPNPPANPSEPDNSNPGTSSSKYSANESLNLRKTASWSGEIITVVKKGTVVEAISVTDNWIKVNYNGNVGYLPTNHLTKVDSSTPSTPNQPNTPDTTPSVKKQMVVNVDDLSVRTGSSTKHKKIGALNKGDVVTVVKELSNGWVKIEFNNGFGYVSNVKGAYLEESKKFNDKASANKVIAMIDALNTNLTLDDMDAVEGARDAYDALNKEAQALVTNLDKLTDAEAEIDRLHALEIEKLNDIIDKIDLIETVITIDNVASERVKLDEIDALIKQVYAPFVQNISNLRKLEAIRAEVEKVESNIAEAKKVSDMIDALNSVLTLNDMDSVEEARKAYDALNKEAQALVTNLDKLTDAEAEIDRLDALEVEKLNDIVDKIDLLETVITVDNVVAERAKIDEIDALISQVYAPFVQNISNLRKLESIRADVEKVESNIVEAKKVSDMIQALDGRVISINDKDELRNIRKAYNTLNKDAQALVQNINVLERAEQAYNAIMDRVKNVKQLIDALPGYDEIELSDEAEIQAVRDAFNALSPEEQNAIPNIQVSILESAESKIQLLKNNAVEVTIAEDLVQRITTLKSVAIDYSHETEIKAIREAFDKLSAPSKSLVVNYNEFLAIELELTHVYESIIYVDGLIEALPDTIEYSHKNQVEDAKAKFDDLGTKNQAGVKTENVTKLTDAVAEIERLEQTKQEILQTNVEVQAVVAEIEQLPDVASITIDDKDQVLETMARFRMLPEDVKFAVDVTPLEEAFDKVETLMAEEVVALIDALPSIDDLNLTHATLLSEVRAKYNEITTRNNMKVTNINTLTELEAKMLELTNANPTIVEIVNKIKDLDDIVTFDNFDDIDRKINEIEALMETIDRDNLYLITNFEKYDEVRFQLETLRRVYHVTTGAEVVELINILPDDLKNVQMSTREAIEDARNAYTKISDSEKLLVDNLAKLEAVEAEFKRIENSINEVCSAIHRIPALDELTLDDKHLVEEARRMYDASDERVKHYINYINIGDLLNAEIKIEKLEKNQSN